MSPSRSSGPPRPGVVLLVVVILLTLFLVVGLSFVLYAESEATASRIYREAPSDKADVPPEQLLAWALGQFVYPVPDDSSGAGSALRGHELARLMYGWHPAPSAANPLVPDPLHTNNPWDPNPDPATGAAQIPYSHYTNTTPFNGLGPLRTLPRYFPTVNEYDMVNYTWFAQTVGGVLKSTDGFLRDPERVTFRQDNAGVPAVNQPLKAYAGGFNVPYTYPDRANMCLAAVAAINPLLPPNAPPNDPRRVPVILTPSFFRPITVPNKGTMINLLTYSTGASAANFWTSNDPSYKYLTLRPRPGDNSPGFPPPADEGGDVKNLPGVSWYYPGTTRPYLNDSFWMDLGFPVQITRNGKKFKPLFAFLVMDMDGKINLNVHGNINAKIPTTGQPDHASSQGVGRHEINVSKVLNADSATNPVEWTQLYRGSMTNVGRYGTDVFPCDGLKSCPDPRILDLQRSLLFPLDFDAVDNAAVDRTSRNPTRQVTRHFNLPMSPFTNTSPAGSRLYMAYPGFSLEGTVNQGISVNPAVVQGSGYDGAYDDYKPHQYSPTFSMDPKKNHPLLNQVLLRSATDAALTDDNMYHLLAGDFTKSALYGLIPKNASSIAVRLLVSTHSYDLDVPGAPPWVMNSTASKYELAANAPYPTGQPMVTPVPAQINNVPVPANDYSDFKSGDGRANLLSRVDLARKLTPYVDATGKFVPPIDPTTHNPIPPPAAATLYTQLPLATFPQYRYYYALYDRQQFAMDILNRLIQASGAASLGRIRAQSATPQEYAAVRYLAQLAVNIVDYVDEDDVITPFPWNNVGAFPWNAPNDAVAKAYEPSSHSPGWVFGTEAPKVVINEAYCELQNHPADRRTQRVTNPFQFSFWVELYNPTPAAAAGPPPADRQDPEKLTFRTPPIVHDRMAAQLERISPNGFHYPVYEVVIVDDKAQIEGLMRNGDNTDGWLDESRQRTFVKIHTTSFVSGGTPSSPDPRDPYAPYFDANFVEPTTGDYDTQGLNQPLPRNQGLYVLAPNQQWDFQSDPNVAIDFTPTLHMPRSRNTDEQPAPSAVAANAPVWGQVKGGTAQNGMSYEAPPGIKSTLQFADRNFTGGVRHTVLLRRLACPTLDPNPLILDPGDPRFGQPFFPNKPFNPYITVDYLSHVPTNDAVKLLPSDVGANQLPKDNPTYMHPHERRSMARRQPYVGSIADLTTVTPNAKPVSATFFKHNSANEPNPTQTNPPPQIDVPYDWLVHLDRAPATVAEILNVSAVPPHRLTQQFVTGKYNEEVNPLVEPNLTTRILVSETKFQHLAPWQDQRARLYRALEFFTVGDRSPFPGTGGRVAGSVNINTVFDRPMVEAVIDARPQPSRTVPRTGNFFFENPGPTGAVTDAWQANGANSILQRKQGLMSGTGPATDRPFWSLAAPVAVSEPTDPSYDPQYPKLPYNYPFPPPPAMGQAGIGVGDTILGGTFTPQHSPQLTPPQVSTDYSPQGNVAYTSAQPPVQPNPQDPSQRFPPYIMNELLNKISGHLTSRSNTFAVFLTVGFFEVTDDTTVPPKLGAEITTSTGKNIRHQMFSIVDRTNLAIDPNAASGNGRLQQAATPPVFMSLGDQIPAGAGAPAAANQPATTVTVNITGGIPTSYDGNTPITFKPYLAPTAATIPFLGNPPPPLPQPPPPSRRWTYWPPGTCQWMYLDMGATQEPVQVRLSQSGTQLELLFPQGAQFSHPPGAMLCTYQPGNPGPQGAIDYTSPQYKAVVPYTYIVQ